MKKTLDLLGIDLGASSGRGIVGSYDGEKLSLREVHRFPNEPQMVAGRFTWDILRLYAESKNAIRAAAGGELRSIGIDTWGVDYGLLDAHGRLIGNPVHYRDRRTEGIISEFGERVMPNEKLYGITGIQLLDFNTVYQLYADRRDGTAAGAARMLFIPDLLGYFLTGNMACEYTVASTGALLDAKKRDFSAEILSALGLERDFFAPLVHPGTSLGNVRGDVGAEVGGCGAEVVSIASHDTAAVRFPAKTLPRSIGAERIWQGRSPRISSVLDRCVSARCNWHTPSAWQNLYPWQSSALVRSVYPLVRSRTGSERTTI